jgi:hypothetical protein
LENADREKDSHTQRERCGYWRILSFSSKNLIIKQEDGELPAISCF